VRVAGDGARLRQVFFNLLDNAIKYTPEGGRVEVRVEARGADAVVVVRDTGVGIPAEHLPHVFDRFYRVDRARTREQGGAGLGLTLEAAEEKARTLQFSKGDVGKVPAGWKADKTGKGDGSVWKVVADETSPSKTGYVLAQTAESPGSMFNLCVAEDTKFKDVE